MPDVDHLPLRIRQPFEVPAASAGTVDLFDLQVPDLNGRRPATLYVFLSGFRSEGTPEAAQLDWSLFRAWDCLVDDLPMAETSTFLASPFERQGQLFVVPVKGASFFRLRLASNLTTMRLHGALYVSTSPEAWDFEVGSAAG